MPSIRCRNCGLNVQVPAGGRRLCGCGAWLSGDDPVPVVEPVRDAVPAVEAEIDPAPRASTGGGHAWPRIEGDLSAIERLNDGYRRIRKEMSKAIVGQEKVLEELLIAIFAKGHCLLVGVPGLAKTLMIRTLADSLSLSFSRVQFTPDLMPSDITGTEVLQEDKATGQRLFKFLHGPIFANVVLADEINRTPPKTQAALLEAMQERQVTVAGTRHKLPDPFFVLATQNPIEQEGTYPLPEAQQDRFMFTVTVGYPSEEDEFRVIESTTSAARPRRPCRAAGGGGAAARPVMRHRVIPNYAAGADNVTPEELLRKFLKEVPPREGCAAPMPPIPDPAILSRIDRLELEARQ